jgi:hypothetical protein
MANRFSRTAAIGLICGLILALGGCGTLFGESKYADDPLYKTGYSDGCGSGTSYVPGDPSTLRRDPNLYGTMKAYRAGWKAGFNSCRVNTATEPGAGADGLAGRRNGPSGY